MAYKNPQEGLQELVKQTSTKLENKTNLATISWHLSKLKWGKRPVERKAH